HGRLTQASGGVTSLSSTSSQRPRTRAGRRQVRSTRAATTARPVANVTFSTAMSNSARIPSPPESESTDGNRRGAFLSLTSGRSETELVHEVAQALPLLRRHRFDAQQMGQQWGERAPAEFLGDRPQMPVDQLVAADGGGEDVRPAAAVAGDVLLALE